MANERLLYVAAVPFEAARFVSILPDGHRARRTHGHSFVAKVRAELPVEWAPFRGAEVDHLRAHLEGKVGPLDYTLLNDALQHPTDENLARWLRKQLSLGVIESVGVQATNRQGVDLDASDNAHVWRRYILQAAHQLPNVPKDHKCGRMHGHGFEVLIHASQSVSNADVGVQYEQLDVLWDSIHKELDHRCLNHIAGLENPTSELIAQWLWNRLKPQLAALSWVTVYETAQCGASYDGARYRIWKEMTLDSASVLPDAPNGDPRSRIHGHTYTLRLHLNAPLDQVMGWTVDFGDVKDLFQPIFKRLDHHPLYEIPGLESSHAAAIARWIKKEAQVELPALDRVDIYETRGCGVVLAWGADEVALPI